jgi:hypothetical protein
MLPRMTPSPPADSDPKEGGDNSLTHILHWLRKSLYIIYILASFELGMLLLCMPWMRVWDNNYLLYLFPQFRALVANPFFKGFVLGLGIANIAIGIHEVAQIRQSWKSKHPSL